MKDEELEHRMEGDVTRVLNAFAATQPPAHLQQRVLAALSQRSAVAGESAIPFTSRARLFSLVPRWGLEHFSCRCSGVLRHLWAFSPMKAPLHAFVGDPINRKNALAATCAAAIVGLAVGMLHHRAVTPQMAAPQAVAHIQPPTTTQVAASISPLTSPVEAARPTRSHSSTPHHRAHDVDRPAKAISSAASLDPATCHCDPVALAEAAAPSHPAPPLPLSRAERHMLLMLHRGETEELAQLDPALRAREFQRERADFNRFFDSSKSQPTEPKQGNDQP